MRSKTSMHQPVAARPNPDNNISDDNLNFTIITKSEYDPKNDDKVVPQTSVASKMEPQNQEMMTKLEDHR